MGFALHPRDQGVALVDQLAERIRYIQGPAHPMQLLQRMDAPRQHMVAEHVANPTRDIPSVQMARQHWWWTLTEERAEFRERLDLAAKGSIVARKDERVSIGDGNVQVFLSMPDVLRQARRNVECHGLVGRFVAARQEHGFAE